MHHVHDTLIFAIFTIYTSATVMATLALFTRQSLMVAYMLLGILIGPYGLKLIPHSELIIQTGNVGIIFLLFLLGLHLHPQKLWKMLRGTALVTLISALLLMVVSFLLLHFFQFTVAECMMISVAMMFSSTIISLKLLPTTTLHHRHTGEIVISILLLQDIIAIVVLIFIQLFGLGHITLTEIGITILALPILGGFAYIMQRFVLIPLMCRFDKIQEYIFLLSIGWCVSMAVLAEIMGLSGEIGAFIAGVALATHPISQYIAESLKTLRDFFLVLFFFAIGAQFNYSYLPQIIVPAVLLALLMLIAKPIIYSFLLRQLDTNRKTDWEIGFRLGQISEFALLIVYLAGSSGLIGSKASYTVQAATIITFIVSSYIVVFFYQTPLAVSSQLRNN